MRRKMKDDRRPRPKQIQLPLVMRLTPIRLTEAEQGSVVELLARLLLEAAQGVNEEDQPDDAH